MSYPEPRYHGDSGLTNATFRRSEQAPELTYPSGGAVHYLATGASTAGEFGLYRWEMAATPSGPDPHFLRTISESFYVLSGEVTLYAGGRWQPYRPGDFALASERGVHGFRNDADEPASFLILFTPGIAREEFFAEMAELRRTGRTPTREEMTAFYARHDQVMVEE